MSTGNTIVAALMNATQLTRDQYAMNHPAGRIGILSSRFDFAHSLFAGKRLTVKVDDVMKPRAELGLCQPNDVLIEKLGFVASIA